MKLLILVIVLVGASNGQNSQKPKFEVQHKAGKMDVLASPVLATVSLKSDTVNVDIRPGDTNVPLQTKPKVLHVYQLPMLGKRSRVPRRAMILKKNFSNGSKRIRRHRTMCKNKRTVK